MPRQQRLPGEHGYRRTTARLDELMQLGWQLRHEGHDNHTIAATFNGAGMFNTYGGEWTHSTICAALYAYARKHKIDVPKMKPRKRKLVPLCREIRS
jgi:hypothetical protein